MKGTYCASKQLHHSSSCDPAVPSPGRIVLRLSIFAVLMIAFAPAAALACGNAMYDEISLFEELIAWLPAFLLVFPIFMIALPGITRGGAWMRLSTKALLSAALAVAAVLPFTELSLFLELFFGASCTVALFVISWWHVSRAAVTGAETSRDSMPANSSNE